MYEKKIYLKTYIYPENHCTATKLLSGKYHRTIVKSEYRNNIIYVMCYKLQYGVIHHCI